MVYVYDGSWDGMLTLIYETSQAGAPEDILRSAGGASPAAGLFDTRVIKTDHELASAVLSALTERIGCGAVRDACLALMSERSGIDCAVWRYAERLWSGKNRSSDLAEPCVSAVFHASRASVREYDKWMGVTRFSDAGGVFYAAIGPECDVLPVLAEHFAKRFHHKWIIHDIKRSRAALHSGGCWTIAEDVPPARLNFSGEEEAVRALWREFFRSITIEERRSAKRQRSFLPKRIWEYLTEQPEE